jgi:hypothetical protein
MTPGSARLGHARKVADAILYEGYLLYPYHQQSQKNQARFQFGVLMPPGYAVVDPHEPSATQTECLLECPPDAQLSVLVRFLRLQRRTVLEIPPGPGTAREVPELTVAGTTYTSWDEVAEQEQSASVPVAALLEREYQQAFSLAGHRAEQDLLGAGGTLAGRLVRTCCAVDGRIVLSAQRLPGPYGALRLRARVENTTAAAGPLAVRRDGLRCALIAAHSLIEVPGGRFVSMTDPPQWAAAEVAACVNTGTWPVLAGPPDGQDLVLSSPVILYDHPEIAAESDGEMFDATEIDEILTLRTLTLTDAEKQQARATDPRAAGLIDRVDAMPAEMLERLHGAIRFLSAAPQQPGVPGGNAAADSWPAQITDRPPVPWWDPGADASVSPETDAVVIAGHRIARGSRVLMRPGRRRADAQDLFLAGRAAVVEAVLSDVDGQTHLALLPEDDPAAELQRFHGRFLYFAPDEIEPIGPAGDLPGGHPEEDRT